jgi:Leucine-rich repeat (LRR) protein
MKVYNYEELIDKNIIPDDCEYFKCHWCNLDKLPELPSGLTELYCYYNNLTELPKLPDGLKSLYCCNNNNLSELPKLPNRLQSLNCSCNLLTELPELPSKLELLYCNHNPIKFITPDNYKIMKLIFSINIYKIDISNTIFYDNSGCSSRAEFFGIE